MRQLRPGAGSEDRGTAHPGGRRSVQSLVRRVQEVFGGEGIRARRPQLLQGARTDARGRRPRDDRVVEVGSGFNTVRVYDGIAYLAGYNSPPTLFGVLIADVRDPRNMKPLSFVPCQRGHALQLPARQSREEDPHPQSRRRTTAIRRGRPPGRQRKAGVSFYDVVRSREAARIRIRPLRAERRGTRPRRRRSLRLQLRPVLARPEARSLVDHRLLRSERHQGRSHLARARA